jgi:hypothetical protein
MYVGLLETLYLYDYNTVLVLSNLLYKKSVNSVDDIPDDLDFVYIDSDHMYPTTKMEIKSYYPKLKKGGILGGHDYDFMFNGMSTIKKAVDLFVKYYKLELYTKFDDTDPLTESKRGIDWWVVKE